MTKNGFYFNDFKGILGVGILAQDEHRAERVKMVLFR